MRILVACWNYTRITLPEAVRCPVIFAAQPHGTSYPDSPPYPIQTASRRPHALRVIHTNQVSCLRLQVYRKVSQTSHDVRTESSGLLRFAGIFSDWRLRDWLKSWNCTSTKTPDFALNVVRSELRIQTKSRLRLLQYYHAGPHSRVSL